MITHYAAFGEEQPTYLMLNDWIYTITKDTLYIFPVGKRLKEREKEEEIQKVIREQFNKHTYEKIQDGIKKCDGEKVEYEYVNEYAKYAKVSLQGVYTRSNFDPPLKLNQEAWFTTLFLALVIPESSRNFRSFPITLMAMDIAQSQNEGTAKDGISFLWNHPVQKGKTWTNTKYRGFYGSSGHELEENKKYNIKNLNYLREEEDKIVKRWLKTF